MRRTLPALALAVLLTTTAVVAAARPVSVRIARERGRITALADRPVTWALLGPEGALYPLYAGNRGRMTTVRPGVDWPSGRYRLLAIGPFGATAATFVTRPAHRLLASLGAGVTPLSLDLHYGLTALYARDLLGQRTAVAVYTPTAPSPRDVDLFDHLYGLPPAHLRYAACVPGPAGDASARAEADVDVEWLHAVAPLARIDLYCPLTAAGPDIGSVAAAPGEAALAGDVAFSLSLEWTGVTYGDLKAAHEVDPGLLLPIPLDHPITVFAASGDNGRAVDAWPPADPHVLAVGGTMWRGGREVYWRDGELGGGFGATTWPRPPWQTLPGSRRRIPDVSANANDYAGVTDGTVQWSEGTSFSAPVWAGLWALVAQDYRQSHGRPIGWGNPLVYRLAQSPYGSLVFDDHPARPDGRATYGRRTGWGSPNPAALDELAVRGTSLFPTPLTSRLDLVRLRLPGGSDPRRR
jgi:hypothetical protein